MSSVGNGEEFDDAAERLDERVEQFRDNAEEAARRGLDTMQNSLADLYDGLADESGRALDTIATVTRRQRARPAPHSARSPRRRHAHRVAPEPIARRISDA